jgi:hypothetical protein
MKKTTRSTNGTSFHDNTITASVRELEEILGAPTFMCNDGADKVNFEWEMETEDGEVFTVYDWKEYRYIAEAETIEWHIGGKSRSETEAALSEILAGLGAATGNPANRREAAEIILDHLAVTPDFETARASALVTAARLKQHYGAEYEAIVKEIKSFNKG